MVEGVTRATVVWSRVWFQPEGPFSVVVRYTQVSLALTLGAATVCAHTDAGALIKSAKMHSLVKTRSSLKTARILAENPPSRQIKCRRDDVLSAVHPSRCTSRNVGNNFIHNSATRMVPTPPNITAGTAPNKAAVTPLSNCPSSLDALMNR